MIANRKKKTAIRIVVTPNRYRTTTDATFKEDLSSERLGFTFRAVLIKSAPTITLTKPRKMYSKLKFASLSTPICDEGYVYRPDMDERKSDKAQRRPSRQQTRRWSPMSFPRAEDRHSRQLTKWYRVEYQNKWQTRKPATIACVYPLQPSPSVECVE